MVQNEKPDAIFDHILLIIQQPERTVPFVAKRSESIEIVSFGPER